MNDPELIRLFAHMLTERLFTGMLTEQPSTGPENDMADREEQSLKDIPPRILQQMGIQAEYNFPQAVQAHLWGTFGRDGKSPLVWLKLVECSNHHLENILATQHHLHEFTKRVIIYILRERRANNDPGPSDRGFGGYTTAKT